MEDFKSILAVAVILWTGVMAYLLYLHLRLRQLEGRMEGDGQKD